MNLIFKWCGIVNTKHHTLHVNTLSGQYVEFLNAELGGTHIYHLHTLSRPINILVTRCSIAHRPHDGSTIQGNRL